MNRYARVTEEKQNCTRIYTDILYRRKWHLKDAKVSSIKSAQYANGRTVVFDRKTQSRAVYRVYQKEKDRNESNKNLISYVE